MKGQKPFATCVRVIKTSKTRPQLTKIGKRPKRMHKMGKIHAGISPEYFNTQKLRPSPILLSSLELRCRNHMLSKGQSFLQTQLNPYMIMGRILGGGSPLGRFRAYRNALNFFRGGVPYFGRFRGGSPKLGRFSLCFLSMKKIFALCANK